VPDILAARAMLSAKSGAGLVRCDPARIQRHQVAAPAHRIVSEGRQVTIILGTTTRLWHEGGLTNDLVAQVMARVSAGLGVELEHRVEHRRRRVGLLQKLRCETSTERIFLGRQRGFRPQGPPRRRTSVGRCSHVGTRGVVDSGALAAGEI